MTPPELAARIIDFAEHDAKADETTTALACVIVAIGCFNEREQFDAICEDWWAAKESLFEPANDTVQ